MTPAEPTENLKEITIPGRDIWQAICKPLCNIRTGCLLTLWFLCFISALAVVLTHSWHRQAFITLQSLHTQEQEYHNEWTQLLIEQSTWASYPRIAKIATEKLGMHAPSPAEIEIIRTSQLPERNETTHEHNS